MSSVVSTAKDVREENPEVAYEDQVFTEPFDIEAQALQVATAKKVGWRLADAFLSFALVQTSFRELGRLHANNNVGFSGLPVVVRMDHDISFILSLLIAAEGRDLDAAWAELNTYLVAHKALSLKYLSAPSTAPQN